MKLQDQVCTIEQALKFEELGIKNHWHEGTLKWTRHEKRIGSVVYPVDWHVVPSTYLDGFGHNGSPWALNCAELGIMMPEYFISYYNEHAGSWMWQAVEPNIHTIDDEGVGMEVTHYDGEYYETEAEARAAAVLYAIDKGLVTVKEINGKLRDDGLGS